MWSFCSLYSYATQCISVVDLLQVSMAGGVAQIFNLNKTEVFETLLNMYPNIRIQSGTAESSQFHPGQI